MELEELIVPLKLNDSLFDSGIEKSITKATAFGNILGNLASSAITGAFNLLGKGLQTVEGFLGDSVQEASDSENAISQLEAVIKSTGGVAGVTSKQAQDLASSLQKVTKYSDEAVLGGENMLLTFTSIGKDIFPRATKTILDMSTALNQDLKSSAIQLGKALNDPITGVTALRRVGVQFSDEQETMIKKMVESGNLMQAQTFILDELQKEFGGSAEAAGKTFAGQLEILKNKLSDIKERIGGALLPVLATLTEKFSNLIDSPKVQALIDTVVNKLAEAGNWIITNLPTWIDKFTEFSTNLSTWWNEDVKPILDALEDKLSKAIPLAIDGAKLSFGFLSDFWKNNVSPIGNEINRLFKNITDILALMGIKVSGVQIGWQFLLTILTPVLVQFKAIKDILGLVQKGLDLMNDILEQAKLKWDKVTSAVRSLAYSLATLALPWWLTPGSPTPLENGLRGVDNALTSINNRALPKFTSGLNVTNTVSSSSSIDYNKLAKVLATELSKAVG